MPNLLNLAAGLAGVFALAVILVTVFGFFSLRKKEKEAGQRTHEALALLDAEGEDQDAADEVARLFEASLYGDLKEFGEALSRVSRLQYEGRMLPDPEPLLEARGLYSSGPVRSLGRLLAWIILGLGSLCLVVILVLSAFVTLPGAALPAAGAVFLLALVLALLLLWQGGRSAEAVEASRKQMISRLAELFPVLTKDQGTALLVSETIAYGEKMRREVQSFSELARDLTQAGFAEGIKKSVREIMSQEVVPPLNDANYALTALARSLASKQEKGMEELAGTFSNSVSEALAMHLAPLPDKLQILHQVAEHSAGMMEEAQASMARTREDSRAISQEVQEAMRLMTLAKDDLSGEMASISGSMELMSRSADKMTALYTGEQTNLASHIKEMTGQLEFYSKTLGTGIDESAKAIETSVRMSASQNKHTAVLLERLDEQIGVLEELGRLIEGNTGNFTKESGAFVSRTLEDFDRGLAEVVERLTFTTAEIRDAVESLPQALRSMSGDR
ncbi:MAG TPA: hypothetical protein GX720_05005 [Clostridiaceae bacterium]|nr:hypothetical protein [Clostridiaceae bacterium]